MDLPFSPFVVLIARFLFLDVRFRLDLYQWLVVGRVNDVTSKNVMRRCKNRLSTPYLLQNTTNTRLASSLSRALVAADPTPPGWRQFDAVDQTASVPGPSTGLRPALRCLIQVRRRWQPQHRDGPPLHRRDRQRLRRQARRYPHPSHAPYPAP